MAFTPKLYFVNQRYIINNANVSRSNQCKDLGVYSQSNLKFNKHNVIIENKAYMYQEGFN